ncbi:hypothetical protein CFK37_03760 [Virgibacillus phasianinus]|uniref:Uncharacterized protein n=1 Tax=Virgibacillus phasianinus TaxID=2017483 RepID=A0A220TZY6_9BACI|nr:hypothetical protein [Virgibacillus phasianinus]ASK61350.1 hypothetical protein CFK37_03760 [Virgibacillus phasianinus]
MTLELLESDFSLHPAEILEDEVKYDAMKQQESTKNKQMNHDMEMWGLPVGSPLFLLRKGENYMDADKRELYIGNREVYLIQGLELDVEFDYISQEERMEAIVELEDYIQEQKMQPVKSDDGYVKVKEDTIIYVAATCEMDYAASFEECHNPEKDHRTERVLDQFYDECLTFWNREEDNSSGFVLAKSPKELAIQDVAFLEHDPTVPNGELLDAKNKRTWLQGKRDQLFNRNTKEQTHDMDM